MDHVADVFDEVRRVLRPDGTLWLNLGDTYTTHAAGVTGAKRWQASTLNTGDHTGAEQAGAVDKTGWGLPEKNLVGVPWRVAFALQDRGWYLRADCIWAKPNPMPESVRDRPTRAHEYVFLLTKSPRYFYDADAVRGPLAPSTEAQARYHYPNAIDNPDTESKWGGDNWRSYPVIGRSYAPSTLREIRDGYNGKATKDYSSAGAQDPSAVKSRFIAGARRRADEGRPLSANLKTVWPITTEPYPDAHFATFPRALVEVCLRAGTSAGGACATCVTPRRHEVVATGGTIGTAEADWHPDKNLGTGRRSGQHGIRGITGKARDGTYRRDDRGFAAGCSCPDGHATLPCLVLDPFCGSGTVLEVARGMGLRSLGIELKPEYVRQARDRAGQTADILSYGGEAP